MRGLAMVSRVEAARLRRDGAAEVLGIVRFDEGGVDAQAAEADVELRVGAAVERAGGDDLIARAHEAGQGQELRGLSAGDGQRPTPPSSEAMRSSNTAVVGFMMRV